MSLDDDPGIAAGGADDRVLKLSCSDGVVLRVPARILHQSQLLRNVLEADPDAAELKLSEIESGEMAAVAEYLLYHVDRPVPDKLPRPLPSNSLRGVVDDWDANFADAMEQDELFRLLVTSMFLGVGPLTDLLCGQVAVSLMGRDPAAIRAAFGLAAPTGAELDELRVLFPGITGD